MLDALDRRRGLLTQLDDGVRQMEKSAGAARLTRLQAQAFDLLLSRKARQAFNVALEPAAVRDRYGRDLFGSSTLLARRLHVMARMLSSQTMRSKTTKLSSYATALPLPS